MTMASDDNIWYINRSHSRDVRNLVFKYLNYDGRCLCDNGSKRRYQYSSVHMVMVALIEVDKNMASGVS